MVTNSLQNNLLTKPVINNIHNSTKNFVQKSVQNIEPVLMKTFLLDRDTSATSHKLAQQKAENLINRLF